MLLVEVSFVHAFDLRIGRRTSEGTADKIGASGSDQAEFFLSGTGKKSVWKVSVRFVVRMCRLEGLLVLQQHVTMVDLHTFAIHVSW